MRPTWLLIGSAALFSAGLFLATSIGSLGTIMLTYLAPLPLFLIGLSKGGKAVGLAGGIATLAVAIAGGSLGAVLYFMACALPVSMICEKATLSRSVGGDPANPTIEWYPPGPLCIWLIATPVSVLLLTFLYFLARGEGLQPVVAQQVEYLMEFYREALGVAGPDGPTGTAPGMDSNAATMAPHQLVLIEKLLTNIAPALLSIFWMLFILLNGALAQGMLSRVGHNMRPTPEMAEIELPRWLIGGFTACFLIGITLSGSLGYLGANLGAILAVPLFLSGLGVAHAAAHKTKYRFGILFMLYTVLMISRWGSLAMIILGLIDHFARLKARMRGGSSPV